MDGKVRFDRSQPTFYDLKASLMGEERWVNVDDVAGHLSVTRDTVYRWMDRKALPAHRLGRVWRFKLSEIDAWVRSGKAAPDRSAEPGNRGD